MPQRPNVLWIQTDEHRADSLGCYGSAWARTPHLDALAARGTVFRRAYCASPVCVPSRSSQLAARYPQELNTLNNAVQEVANVFPAGTLTFPEVFARAGYQTANFGKSHTPAHPTWQFNDRAAMDKRYASPWKLNEAYDEARHRVVHRPGGERGVILGGTYPSADDHPSRQSTDKAIRFLDTRDAGKPFLLRVSHNWPHTPVLPPPPWDRLFAPEELPIRLFDAEALAARCAELRRSAAKQNLRALSGAQLKQIWTDYMGLVACVDHEVGRLLAALEARGLREDTLVVFSADHGTLLGEWGATQKGNFDELVWRVPFIWSCPGRIPEGQVRDDLAALLDTGRTLLGCAGLADHAPEGWRGRDLFRDPAPEAVFGQIHYPNRAAEVLTRPGVRAEPLKPGQAMRVAVRTARHRLDADWMLDGRPLTPAEADGHLFDLEADPLERANRWDDPAHRGTREALWAALQRWQGEIDRNPELFETRAIAECGLRNAD
ncbi:MAG: sulfatase-like hydrolase/transferase [Planctomycetota bacterium]|nr:sulfatase-like hydrolase/transferase [Planctomycetota bacterium]